MEQMQIEIRNDSVLISGYVNAIERYSRPIRERSNGKIKTYIEKIQAGAFKNALTRNDNVLVLLNHDYNRKLANTRDGSAKLEEDNIGLRAEVTITDEDVIEKAKNNQLSGWSFGFYCNSDVAGKEGLQETRTVTDLDLVEVSILDSTKRPAYYGQSIQARDEDGKILEIRSDDVSLELDADTFAEIIAEKVVKRLKMSENNRSEEEPESEEQRSEPIDYSDYDNRLTKIQEGKK